MSNLIEEARKLSNVKIVDLPTILISYNNSVPFHISARTNIINSPIDYIKHNEHKIFYIYEITENLSRWYELEDINLLRKVRQKKLQKINLKF
jgi:hypothetical protein